MARSWLVAIPIALGAALLILTLGVAITWLIGQVRPTLFDRFPVWGPIAVGIAFFLVVSAGIVVYMVLSLKAWSLHLRQTRFLDAVTHELKTPLASLRLYVETLLRRNLSDREREDFYGAMLEEIDRLDELTEQLLDAARASGGRWRGTRRPVPVLPVLEDCVARCYARYNLPEEAIRLDAEPVVIEGWEAALRSVLDNLLQNAVKYSDGPPEISVRVRETAPGTVRIEVKDRGRGVPPHLGTRIYQRFVRGNRASDLKRPGTGLGLYVVWSLMRAMKGRLGHANNTDGPGATFYVELRGWRSARESSSSKTSAPCDDYSR